MKKEDKKITHFELIVALSLSTLIIAALTFLFVIFFAKNLSISISSKFDNSESTNRLSYVASEIKSLFEDYGITEDIDYDKANTTAIEYYVAAYGDKYSDYKTGEELKEFNDDYNESSVGMGVSWIRDGKTPDWYYIDKVYPNSGAEKAGLKVGDLVTAISGVPVSTLTQADFYDFNTDDYGDTIELTVLRDGEYLDFEVELIEFKTNSVSFRILAEDKNVGYIEIDKFSKDTPTELKEALNYLKSSGIEDYIIDVRRNHGGEINSVVDSLDYICPEGLLIRTEGKMDQSNSEYYSDASEFNGNFVVLIDEETASAAELFAITLKEFNKANLIGVTTFGKGTVVSTIPLSSGGALTLSTALYYTHLGNNIEGVGVEPDIKVEQEFDEGETWYNIDDTNDTQLQYAIQYIIGDT